MTENKNVELVEVPELTQRGRNLLPFHFPARFVQL